MCGLSDCFTTNINFLSFRRNYLYLILSNQLLTQAAIAVLKTMFDIKLRVRINMSDSVDIIIYNVQDEFNSFLKTISYL